LDAELVGVGLAVRPFGDALVLLAGLVPEVVQLDLRSVEPCGEKIVE
jgi:hypothetical protein